MLDELLSERDEIKANLQEIIGSRRRRGGSGSRSSRSRTSTFPPTWRARSPARPRPSVCGGRKIINAEGEFQAAERVKDAALVIEEHPVALQLRYLQTLLELRSPQATTIVFPPPIDLLTLFLNL
jgi:regulator of protease activity HflC (stomatin/prohibitin superfamily)